MTLQKRFVSGCIMVLLHASAVQAQDLAAQLGSAVHLLEADPQLKHGIIGFCVADSKTGKIIFERNAELGLAAASCQKVITSGAAFELLGKDYRYQTTLGYNGKIENGSLKGDLYVTGNGDPTLGSWRYAGTTDSMVRKRWMMALRKLEIKTITGRVIADDHRFSGRLIPGGWIWDDVGNYYGAGAGALNWRENQYDLILKSGKKPGDPVELVFVSPEVSAGPFINELTSAEAGTGDQAYIYLPSLENRALLSGTIPINQNRFAISGALTDPGASVQKEIRGILKSLHISETGDIIPPSNISKPPMIFDVYQSPPFDSINYWFLKKSINLYGEALIKTIGLEKTGLGSTQKGGEIVKSFWSGQGVDPSAINIQDGSGLSPQNRITAAALVQVMQYARSRPWFNSFYQALPQINQLAMKSGSIGGARSFTGYAGKDGNTYTFALIVNNYNGSAGDVVRKMYRLLDILK